MVCYVKAGSLQPVLHGFWGKEEPKRFSNQSDSVRQRIEFPLFHWSKTLAG